MRILILSCNTGQGHNSVAMALKEEIINNGDECEVTDALQFISKRASRVVSGGHAFMYRHLPGLFRWGYWYAENHRNLFESHAAIYGFFSQGTQRLYRFCVSGSYDAVICTHVFAALMATDLIRNTPFHPKTYFVATDYTCSPSVDQSGLDCYFIPAGTLDGEFIKAGIPRSKIIPVGIPVRSMFFSRTKKELAKQQYGIPGNHRHALLMCGSIGCGPIRQLVGGISKGLPHGQHLTVVCGTNKALYRRLAEVYRTNSQVHIYPYVENMSMLLDSADLYVTKPGGISVTEAAVKRLPMVFIHAVAGCENYNMHYFMSRGCAVITSPVSELAKLCLSLLSDDVELDRMKEAYDAVPQANAAEYISRYVCGGEDPQGGNLKSADAPDGEGRPGGNLKSADAPVGEGRPAGNLKSADAPDGEGQNAGTGI